MVRCWNAPRFRAPISGLAVGAASCASPTPTMPPSASKSPMRGISRWRDMIRTGASRSAGNCRSVPDRHADPRARRVERFGERIKFALLALDARREDVEERDRLEAKGRPAGGDPLDRKSGE